MTSPDRAAPTRWRQGLYAALQVALERAAETHGAQRAAAADRAAALRQQLRDSADARVTRAWGIHLLTTAHLVYRRGAIVSALGAATYARAEAALGVAIARLEALELAPTTTDQVTAALLSIFETLSPDLDPVRRWLEANPTAATSTEDHP